ncbi:hypothetical protein TNCV_4552681 [Trichonephila clavipes]|nr:hypothetical protein TNCV_4552681 [Trichonephila clavipes]
MSFCALHIRVKIPAGRLLIWRLNTINPTLLKRHIYKGVSKEDNQLCVFPSTDDREGSAYCGHEDTISRPDSNELLCTSHKSRDINRWPHCPHRGTLTGVTCRDEILDPFNPYSDAVEHLRDYFSREVHALSPPPRSLHEQKQGLLHFWSSLLNR